ncbi:MAG: carboxylating nicotinate-nucleotide diphosphorylase [Legionellaceae bacterium]|nr:carboxylating nicotinate-nucleotide diphosphorylase [Legionellaceae bacterium]
MNILSDVRRALEEDIGSGDVTATLLPHDKLVRAVIISREPMLVCGQAWVECAFSEVDSSISLEWFVTEGSWQASPTTLCELQGPVQHILTAERTALNFLQLLSGTATTVHTYLQQLKGYKTRLLDTRKTIPGLRQAQKYAVSCAGGINHRMGLYDAFLIKENHIKACGSITAAISLANQSKEGLFIEIEVETLEELQEALDAKPDRIMLDNFDINMIETAVIMCKTSPCELEVSGNVDLSSISAIAHTGVDYISVGALTKSVRAIDLSLLISDLP